MFLLKPHQIETVEWLATPDPRLLNMPHKYVAHDMGLGKTITAIAGLKRVKAKSALIVCPPGIKDSAMTGWKARMVEWGLCDESKIGVIQSQKPTAEWDRPYLIVGWQMACTAVPLAYLRSRKFGAVILDEARALKSLTSATTKTFLTDKQALIRCGYHKWLLDGTPMPNRPIEWFPVLKVLAEPLLGKYAQYHAFGQRFCGYDAANPEDVSYTGSSNLEELAEIIAPFVHQLRVDDVYDLPEIRFHDIYIDIGQTEDIDVTNTPQASLRKYVGLQKLPFGIEIIKEKITQLNKKVVVFVHHREVLQALVDALDGIPIIGGMSSAERQTNLDLFKHPESIRPLIASNRAAGHAIDGLQSVCSNLIIFEMDWAAGVNNQIVGRVKRYGQEQEMDVWRLIAAGTLDDPVLGTHHQKNRRIDKLFTTQEKEKPNMFENLIDLVTRGVVALETIAEGMSGEAPAATEQKPPANKGGRPPKDNAKPAEGKKGAANAESVTLDDCRAALTKLAQALGDEGEATKIAREHLKKVYKAAKSSELKEADFPKYLAWINEQIAAAEATSEEGGGVNDV